MIIAMGSHARPTRRSLIVLVAAIAGAGLVGFLISRPDTQSLQSHPTQEPSSAPSSQSPMPTPAGPFSTTGFSVADDLARHQIVVFGGNVSLDQTWIWNGKRWNHAKPAASPPGRYDAAAAYDPDMRMVVLFGGSSLLGPDLSDTWGWDGITWHELDHGANGPPPSDGPAMGWDPHLNEMVLVTSSPSSISVGETWTWADGHWARRADTAFPALGFAMGFDPLTVSLVGVGCCGMPATTGGTAASTWRWDGTIWDPIVTRDVPSMYATLGLGWDPVGGRLLLFGQGASSLDPLLEWEWNGNNWLQQPAVFGPAVSEAEIPGDDMGKLQLVGELDTAQGQPTPIGVWVWADASWKPAA
jgi:hypothetical protein